MFHLCEPRGPRGIRGRSWSRGLWSTPGGSARLQERLAAVSGRLLDDVAADMRTGRLLSAEEARAYGLVDTTEPAGRGPGGPGS